MGRQKLCGLRPLENNAFRFMSMCWGVTVAAMLAGADATNSAASCEDAHIFLQYQFLCTKGKAGELESMFKGHSTD